MSPPGRDASFRNGMDGTGKEQARPEEITCESESLSLRLQQLNRLSQLNNQQLQNLLNQQSRLGDPLPLPL